MPATRSFALAVLAALTLVCAAPLIAEWPQWRGPDGRGVATDPGPLPESWETGDGAVRWRVEIPGEGISSPIASDGQVFVATAYRPPGQRLVGLVLRVLAALLAVIVALLALRWRRHEGSGLPDPGERRDAAVVLAATWLFAFIALIVAVRPELLLPEGNPGRVWRNAGGAGLLGLAAAFGWFPRRSAWRLTGVAAVAVAAGWLLSGMPSGAYGSAGLSKALPSVILGLLLAAWYLLAFVRARTALPAPRAAWLAPAIVVLAALVFLPPNYMSGLHRAVVSVDLESGELLWQTTVLRGPAEQKWERSSYATPTPATDGESVFAYFGHGLGSVGLDGKLRWRRDLPGYARHTRYGAGSSPVLTDRAVILVRESEANQGGPPSWIAAFDKSSGDELWRIEPPGAHDSYTTPLLYRSNGGEQLLVPSWKTLVSYDPDSGRRLWSIDYPMEQMVASIASSGNLLALTGGAYGEKVLMVLRLEGEGENARAEVLWQTNKGVATIASPVIYRDLLITVTTPGVLVAHDVELGTELWKKRLDGEHLASPIAGDGKIYALSTEGTTSVVAASRELELIAENELDESVYASPAIAGGCLLIRTATSLLCIERQAEA